MTELTRESLMAGIFGTDTKNSNEDKENSNNVIQVPLEDIRDFGGENRTHRFKLKEEKVEEIVDSIDVIGKIFTPCILRVDPDNIAKYECLAGHHRRAAAARKNLKTVPAIVIDCENDIEAQSITAITNTQQELTLMEKAYLLRYEYDYLKHQGKSLDGKWAISELEKSNLADGKSGRTLRRYIKLTYLIEPFQEMIESKTLHKNVGLILSDLIEDDQKSIFSLIKESGLKIDVETAILLKQKSEQEGSLSLDSIRDILFIEKIKAPKKINVSIPEYAKEYFPQSCDTAEKRNNLILKLLVAYKDNPDLIDISDGETEDNE